VEDTVGIDDRTSTHWRMVGFVTEPTKRANQRPTGEKLASRTPPKTHKRPTFPLVTVVGREGFLGMESARGDDGLGITVCCWRSQEDINAWRTDLEHEQAQGEGRAQWCDQCTVEVARVDRTIEFRRAKQESTAISRRTPLPRMRRVAPMSKTWVVC